MIQSFIVWLFGPELCGILFIFLFVFIVFTYAFRIIEDRWWWDTKDK